MWTIATCCSHSTPSAVGPPAVIATARAGARGNTRRDLGECRIACVIFPCSSVIGCERCVGLAVGTSLLTTTSEACSDEDRRLQLAAGLSSLHLSSRAGFISQVESCSHRTTWPTPLPSSMAMRLHRSNEYCRSHMCCVWSYGTDPQTTCGSHLSAGRPGARRPRCRAASAAGCQRLERQHSRRRLHLRP